MKTACGIVTMAAVASVTGAAALTTEKKVQGFGHQKRAGFGLGSLLGLSQSIDPTSGFQASSGYSCSSGSSYRSASDANSGKFLAARVEMPAVCNIDTGNGQTMRLQTRPPLAQLVHKPRHDAPAMLFGFGDAKKGSDDEEKEKRIIDVTDGDVKEVEDKESAIQERKDQIKFAMDKAAEAKAGLTNIWNEDVRDEDKEALAALAKKGLEGAKELSFIMRGMGLTFLEQPEVAALVKSMEEQADLTVEAGKSMLTDSVQMELKKYMTEEELAKLKEGIETAAVKAHDLDALMKREVTEERKQLAMAELQKAQAVAEGLVKDAVVVAEAEGIAVPKNANEFGDALARAEAEIAPKLKAFLASMKKAGEEAKAARGQKSLEQGGDDK